jgi:CheY-like chemotaxis protein
VIPASPPENPSRDCPAPGARILVAEDNIVNQKVALRQLQKLGCAADSVANGLEVLAALKQIPYDIILMDCQMPELDGYEAARLIRDEEKKSGARSRAYIIAMTANAQAGDREECLNAGMDDYIGKPVRTDELEQAFQRAMKKKNEEGKTELSAHIDLLIVESLKELRSPGEPDPFEELLALFCEDAPARIAQLEEAFKKQELGGIERAAHSLKGSSSNLGAKQLAALASQIMEHARSGQLPPASLVEAIQPEFGKAKQMLESLARGS